MTRKETERDQTECLCDDWVIDFPPEWNHMELTNRRSPSCPSVNRCSLGTVAAGSGTEGWSQVRMEHFDRVALTPEPGEGGTAIGQRGRGKENGLENWEQRGKKGGGGKEGREREKMSQGQELILSYFISYQTRSI